MKVDTISWKTDSDEDEIPANATYCCPLCDRTWIIIDDYEASVEFDPECPHLQFLRNPGMDHLEELDTFNGFDRARLAEAAWDWEQGESPSDEPVTDEGRVEAFGDAMFELDFWEKAIVPGVDTLLVHEYSTMTCSGPLDQILYFGIASTPPRGEG
jgi:hypothetical protein